MTNGDSCTEIPDELIVIGKSKHAVQAVKHISRDIYGV